MNRKETDVFEDIEGLVLEDARKLYSQTVIDHYMHPRNLEPLQSADCFTAMSGICGDTIGIFVKLANGDPDAGKNDRSNRPSDRSEDESAGISSNECPFWDLRIERCTFVTDGCGPTIACGSALTCLAKGRTVREAMKLTSKDLIESLGGLPLENTHCADLAVNTLRGALAKAENL